MVAEKKLEYFADVLAHEIEAKKRRATHRLANDLSQSTANAIESAEKKMLLRVEKMRNELTAQANKKIAYAANQAKSLFFVMQTKHRAKLLEDVRKNLEDFTKTDDYQNWLTQKILDAKAAHRFAHTVKIRPQDSTLRAKIETATALAVIVDDDDYIGGFVLQCETGKTRADYTFREKLQEVQI